MPNPTLTKRWMSYQEPLQTIHLGPRELLWLLEHSGRQPDAKPGEPVKDDEVVVPVKLQVLHPETLRQDLDDVDCAITALVEKVKHIKSYGGTFGKYLTSPDDHGEVNCRDVMLPYRQCAAWSTEVLKEVARMQCAIARLGSHVLFTHECPDDPCTVPIPPDDAKPGSRLTRRERQRAALSNERQTTA
ncbi:MAG: hypothetical protein M5U07_25015 [Xanthobacteraceae bacterium]|nr:hypothetical protein [Burkholderiales bacterium]MCZ7660870.1 hypothetical protein [Xanthobacteraceae bacterium]PWB60100.1 MAG: hypothetical protein C3F17_15330 [Bradyrhizobiaceae bacterium]